MQEAREAQNKVLEAFADKLRDIQKLPDAGERLLGMRDLRREISALSEALTEKSKKKTKIKGIVADLGVYGVLVTASVVLTSGLLFIPAFMTSLWGGKAVKGIVVDAEERKFFEETKEFFAALKEQGNDIQKRMNRLMDDEMPALYQSSRRAQIEDEFSRVRHAFERAARQNASGKDGKPQDPTARRFGI